MASGGGKAGEALGARSSKIILRRTVFLLRTSGSH